MWAGVGLVRGGAGTALVGSHEEVADRIEEYAAVGIDEFILSAYPHLEGAYWFGEGVLPILAEARPAGPTRRPPPSHARRCRSAASGPQGRVMSARVAVVVGNPKPASRTLEAATHLARELAGEPDLVVDLADARPGAARLGGPATSTELVEQVGAADLVVVASPTYKATYTGLLKVFLDRFAGGTGLRGVAVPLMLGAGPDPRPRARAARCGRCWPSSARTSPCAASTSSTPEHDDPAAYADWLGADRADRRPRLTGNLTGAAA